jgi:hypothetical protein
VGQGKISRGDRRAFDTIFDAPESVCITELAVPHFWRKVIASSFLLLGAVACLLAAPQTKSQPDAASPAPPQGSFEPLERWRIAVLSGDAAALKALYSAQPPAQVATQKNSGLDVDEEIAYWTGLKKTGLTSVKLEMVKTESLRADVSRLFFQVAIEVRADSGLRKLYAPVAQVWVKHGEAWQLAASRRQEFARLRQPIFPSADLYPPDADAKAEIQEALARAARSRKRVLLVFGGNWCYDCHVLEAALYSPEIAPLLAPNFELVHVDIGHMDKNLDLAQKYEIPLDKGVPAIAVLEANGTLLYSQKKGEFEAAHRMGPEEIVEFLARWKPQSRSQ